MKVEYLPSGNPRYVVNYYDAEGKRHKKSFTDVDREVAKQRALDFQNKHRKAPLSSGSFGVLLNRYIDDRRQNLSPSTIVSYENIKKRLQKDFPLFYSMPICNMSKRDIQDVVNSLSRSMSPKTVRNYSGLISGVLRDNDVAFGFVSLPKKQARDVAVPSEDEVRSLIAASEGSCMYIPVLLGAFAGLRRGEVCALEMSDIDFKKKTIHVCRDVVLGSGGVWHVKPPKTIASDRFVELPAAAISAIRSAGVIYEENPRMLSYRFHKLCMNTLGRSYRFHDLRHFCASWMHSLGVPDSYIMQRCGWQNDQVLKSIYRHTLSDQEKKFSDLTNSSFDSFL